MGKNCCSPLIWNEIPPAWAEVVATGPNVRQMEPGDHVLFNPEERYEVEVRGTAFEVVANADHLPPPARGAQGGGANDSVQPGGVATPGADRDSHIDLSSTGQSCVRRR